MIKGDFIWIAVLAAVACFIIVPVTHEIFVSVTATHPYLIGFAKFGILATMGELLAIRLVSGKYKKPVGIIYRAIIWGFIGMLMVLMFHVFSVGVGSAFSNGLLYSFSNQTVQKFFLALGISVIMNVFFAPCFMIMHRFTDTYIDLGKGKLSAIVKVPFKNVVAAVDWQKFFNFVILKTIPFFWIPAHTVNFLLPAEYRVLVAAFYSIALGAFLAYGNRKK